jgi:hypothetical protein
MKHVWRQEHKDMTPFVREKLLETADGTAASSLFLY